MVGICFARSRLSSDNEKWFLADESSCERFMLSLVTDVLMGRERMQFCIAKKTDKNTNKQTPKHKRIKNVNLHGAAEGGPQTLPKQNGEGEEFWLTTCPPSVSPFHIFFLSRAARSDLLPQQHSHAPPLGTFRPDDKLEPSSTFPVHSPQSGVLARSPNERPLRPASFSMKTQQLGQ